MRRTLRLLHLQNLFHKPREMVRDDSSAVAAHPGCSLNLDVVPVHAAARTGNLNPLAACSLNDLRVFWTYGKFHPNPPLCYYAVRRNLDSRPCALAEDESYSKRARSSKSEGSEPASVTVLGPGVQPAAARSAQPRPARVWVVIFDEKDVKAFAGLSPHLRGYRESRRVQASGAYALLLERASARLRRGG